MHIWRIGDYRARRKENALSEVDIALSIALGIGLAAATGFRVFLPLLVLSLASRYGGMPLSDGFAWLSSPAAMSMLAVAATLEALAYFMPGLDHMLDTLATPAAVAAGILVAAAVMVDLPPMLKWVLAIIAGGGAAALTQGTTVALRTHSAIFTAGLGNPLVAGLELIASLAMSLVALAAPFIAVALVGLAGLLAVRALRKASRAGPPAWRDPQR